MPILQMRQLRIWLDATQSAGRVILWGVVLSWALRVLGREARQGTPSHTVPLTHEGMLGFVPLWEIGVIRLWKELQ